MRVEAAGRALGEVPKATEVVSLARAAAEAGEEHARVEELRVHFACLAARDTPDEQ